MSHSNLRKQAVLLPLVAAVLALAGNAAHAVLLAGVDFEGINQATFDRNPDDHDLLDGITVSNGNAPMQFDGWTLVRLSDNASFTGLLRNDNGANLAGATTPNFPARLEGGAIGSWSINIPAGVVLNMDRIEFDVRAATGGSGRDGFFRTSLDGATNLWEDLNLPGRNTGWLHVVVDLSGPLYQGLTNQSLAFIWETNTSSGTGAIDLDTIQVYGDVVNPIPEPATAALAMMGLAGLMARRRRVA